MVGSSVIGCVQRTVLAYRETLRVEDARRQRSPCASGHDQRCTSVRWHSQGDGRLSCVWSDTIQQPVHPPGVSLGWDEVWYESDSYLHAWHRDWCWEWFPWHRDCRPGDPADLPEGLSPGRITVFGSRPYEATDPDVDYLEFKTEVGLLKHSTLLDLNFPDVITVGTYNCSISRTSSNVSSVWLGRKNPRWSHLGRVFHRDLYKGQADCLWHQWHLLPWLSGTVQEVYLYQPRVLPSRSYLFGRTWCQETWPQWVRYLQRVLH